MGRRKRIIIPTMPCRIRHSGLIFLGGDAYSAAPIASGAAPPIPAAHKNREDNCPPDLFFLYRLNLAQKPVTHFAPVPQPDPAVFYGSPQPDDIAKEKPVKPFCKVFWASFWLGAVLRRTQSLLESIILRRYRDQGWAPPLLWQGLHSGH